MTPENLCTFLSMQFRCKAGTTPRAVRNYQNQNSKKNFKMINYKTPKIKALRNVRKSASYKGPFGPFL